MATESWSAANTVLATVFIFLVNFMQSKLNWLGNRKKMGFIRSSWSRGGINGIHKMVKYQYVNLRNRNHKSLTDSGCAIKLFGTGAAKRLVRVYSRFTSTSCKFFWWLVGQAQKFFWLGEQHKSWRDISAVKGLPPVLLKNLPCPLDTVPAHVKSHINWGLRCRE